MPDYFKYFPKIEYNGKVVTDITKRAKILDDVENDPYAYMPYTIKDGESPEEIAQFYYGDVAHVWLVWYSNQTIDPYFDWPLPYVEWEKTLAKKYKAQAEKDLNRTDLTDDEIVQWTQSNATNENILYYYDEDDTHLSKDSIINGSVPSSGWIAKRIYEYEDDTNEAKRDIRLMNKSYLDLATDNLKRIMNGRK